MRGILFLLCALALAQGQAYAGGRVSKGKTKTPKSLRAKAKAASKNRAKVRAKGANKAAAKAFAKLGRNVDLLANVRAQTAKRNQKRGLRVPPLRMRASGTKKRKYLRIPISEKQVGKIRSTVEALQAASPDEVIVFRGQEQATEKMQATAVRERGLAKAVKEYRKAARAKSVEAAEIIEKVAKERYPKQYHVARAAHLSKVSGTEILAIESQSTTDSRFFISTTRDLSVAFGNFYKAPNIRYIYILSVPKQQTLNVYGLVAERERSLNLPQSSNQREKELAIPLQATEFVRAVYDIKTDTLTLLARE